MSSSTNYGVVIQMPQATVDGLTDNGYSLYGFKAVDGPGRGVPLVWFSSQDFGLSTTVDWSESYQAYTSRSQQVAAYATITADNSYDAGLGDVLTVDSTSGTGTVTEGGDPRGISINNTTSTPFLCGISLLQNGVCSPIAAFPLFGNGEDLLIPVEKIFLMFASRTVNPGTAIEKSFTSGILIDLAGSAPDAQGVGTRQVSFDINGGWDAAQAPWGTVCPPNTDLVRLLISNAEAGQLAAV